MIRPGNTFCRLRASGHVGKAEPQLVVYFLFLIKDKSLCSKVTIILVIVERRDLQVAFDGIAYLSVEATTKYCSICVIPAVTNR